MPPILYTPPQNLTEVAHFDIPRVQTWGDGKKDAGYKELVRQCAGLTREAGQGFAWFTFSIRCVVSQKRRRKLGPDVENIPKLIVDAFTGLLFPDDNLDYVRGVQVEAVFSPPEEEKAEVWIYAQPRD